jgi:hypothetical protein
MTEKYYLIRIHLHILCSDKQIRVVTRSIRDIFATHTHTHPLHTHRFAKVFAKIFVFAKVFAIFFVFASFREHFLFATILTPISVHVPRRCQICFEIPSGFDSLMGTFSYTTVGLISGSGPGLVSPKYFHNFSPCLFSQIFVFAKVFVIFVTFRKLFSQKANTNVHEKTKTKIFVSTLHTTYLYRK